MQFEESTINQIMVQRVFTHLEMFSRYSKNVQGISRSLMADMLVIETDIIFDITYAAIHEAGDNNGLSQLQPCEIFSISQVYIVLHLNHLYYNKQKAQKPATLPYKC